MRGLLVTIEGPEGAGKTTQRELMAAHLREAGVEVVLTREPGGTPMAERIREVLLTPSDEQMCNKTELMLMFAARAQHLDQVIMPALERGAFVLCDRFVDSSYAYQHYGRGMPLEDLQMLEQYVLKDMPPYHTFFLNIPSQTGMARASARGRLDRFELEGQAFFSRVVTGFKTRAAAEPHRFTTIDADKPVKEVFAQIRPHLQLMLTYRDWNKHHDDQVSKG